MQTTKDMDRALGLAEEHRVTAAREGANHARCVQLREEITLLVGSFREGRLTLPPAVRVAMLGADAVIADALGGEVLS